MTKNFSEFLNPSSIHYNENFANSYEKFNNYCLEKTKNEKKEREDLKSFAKSQENLNPKERAYNFIQYYYKKYKKYYGEEEFLILLISREMELQDDFQSPIYYSWKEAEKREKDRFLDQLQQQLNELPTSEIYDRFKNSIPNFWRGRRNELNTIDSTFIRVIDNLKLSGFDDYCQVLKKDFPLNFYSDISEITPLIQYLYSLCRSECAIELFYDKLSIIIESIITHNKYSEHRIWEFYYYDHKIRNKEIKNSPYIAAGLMFIIIRLGKKEMYPELLTEIKNYLLSTQLENGGWKMFSNNEDLSLETTALCIHALGIYDLRNLGFIINESLKELYIRQDPWGMWFESDEYFVGYEFLTVLILDAIEICERNTDKITFNFNYIPKSINSKDKISTIIMNTYNLNKSQVGAIGKNATSNNNTFNQKNYSPIENLDFKDLDSQLNQLLYALKDNAKFAKDYTAIANVINAQEETQNKNYNGIVENLLKGGKWVFDTAKDIGVNIVSEIINKQISG